MDSKTKNILINILHWTWGIIQTLLGFMIYLFNTKQKHININGTVITEIPGQWGGVSLGKFVFVDSMPDGEYAYSDNTVRHEYGHSIQSLILGPLWLFIIGIPSFIWASIYTVMGNRIKASYYNFYTEKWADKLGGVERGKV